MTEYEIVTEINLYAADSAPLTWWQFFCVNPGVLPEAECVEPGEIVLGTQTWTGWWMRWADPDQFPCATREATRKFGLSLGQWRRPVTAQSKPVAACECTQPESEAQALSKFFATPAGKWKGFSP